MKLCGWLLIVVLSAFVIQQSDAQANTNVFAYIFNSIFRRSRVRPTSSSTGFFDSPSTSTTDLFAYGSTPSSLALLERTSTVTVTTTVVSEIAPTETVSEFFTVTETLTERLIATSTFTRKMTATATHVVNTCAGIESTFDVAGLRRISWKEIPNRIDELLKVPAAIEP